MPNVDRPSTYRLHTSVRGSMVDRVPLTESSLSQALNRSQPELLKPVSSAATNSEAFRHLRHQYFYRYWRNTIRAPFSRETDQKTY